MHNCFYLLVQKTIIIKDLLFVRLHVASLRLFFCNVTVGERSLSTCSQLTAVCQSHTPGPKGCRGAKFKKNLRKIPKIIQISS